MQPKKSDRMLYIILGTIIYLSVLFFACHCHVCAIEMQMPLIYDILPAAIEHMKTQPFALFPLDATTILAVTFFYLVAVIWIWVEHDFKKQDAPGKEAGSAKWFDDWKAYRKRYVDPADKKNMIFSNEVKLNMNIRKTRKNNNVLVIGKTAVLG